MKPFICHNILDEVKFVSKMFYFQLSETRNNFSISLTFDRKGKLFEYKYGKFDGNIAF